MRRGFTILEVTLVLAVMLVLASIILPSVDAMYGDLRTQSAADAVRARWAEARTRAVEDGVAYRFGAIPETGKYRLAPDAPEFWSGGGGNALPDSDAEPMIVEDELPSGVTFAEAGGGGGGDYRSIATFLADGTAREDVEITFIARSSGPLVMRLRSLTGAVTVRKETGRN